MSKPVTWKCPYCLSPHTDSYVRCTGCGNKRSERFAVDTAGAWIAADPTDGQSLIGCLVAKAKGNSHD